MAGGKFVIYALIVLGNSFLVKSQVICTILFARKQVSLHAISHYFSFALVPLGMAN